MSEAKVFCSPLITYDEKTEAISELCRYYEEGLEVWIDNDTLSTDMTVHTSEEAATLKKFLLDYVKKGGNMIVQYNTNRRVNVDPPYPLKLSRDRVTDEFSEVTILDETHELLNFPNKITAEDFKGWVQERGLYFPNAWDENFTAILSMYDKGELPKNGSLLIAKYGEGNYIYTGLSFFRELPAGVSGAYKLFANMLSVGKKK